MRSSDGEGKHEIEHGGSRRVAWRRSSLEVLSHGCLEREIEVGIELWGKQRIS